MTAETYAAYLLATVIVLIIPGPTIMLVVSCSLTQGRRAALPLALGVGLGDMAAMAASLAGLGALLNTSATLFTVLKWIGALYLIYLGIKTWRARPELGASMARMHDASSRSNCLRAFAVTATNPKSIAFFCAFVPQFITQAAPVLPQALLLGSTFVILAVVNAVLYALLAARARKAVASQRAMKIVNRVGGSALIGAGVLTAAMRRA
ncbi:MAG: LysE family translocator [Pseudodesulfovibrio sp.]|uniref:Lysine exporter protein (LYSE/YGGA) n=1 Tax=Pseudodesulfovibrio aespoeensis (strain ATCC 700646 / DSM 10631 / Aspo-2) TaxID=643562 RepID=E6VZG7_PSEA9|nr:MULTISPECIES: LysE family translocator [Pseudodesulfovibrio]MBU4192590.1 LysE family translocator [Pseudomonadota bacterium]MCG2734422.1 LysE family translocator [Pseudodesulfovibrio aespoeensis]ADU61681.1 Lysine exporter protein (LYSE/YGGA) [Pseudodesulfovibrio aespoeensis Aspo-2]MBU4242902.1 LysE family translocator [Pseudomonadota bacterium]MBU4379785.1 LysE family translocator [Pseudomonadota bacterium]